MGRKYLKNHFILKKRTQNNFIILCMCKNYLIKICFEDRLLYFVCCASNTFSSGVEEVNVFCRDR